MFLEDVEGLKGKYILLNVMCVDYSIDLINYCFFKTQFRSKKKEFISKPKILNFNEDESTDIRKFLSRFGIKQDEEVYIFRPYKPEGAKMLFYDFVNHIENIWLTDDLWVTNRNLSWFIVLDY